MNTTQNTAAAIETAANELWNNTVDSKVKMELRSCFEQNALGFPTAARYHLTEAIKLATIRVNLTRAAIAHIENAIVGCESYNGVELRSTFIRGEACDLAGIVSRLECLDIEADIAMNSMCDLSDEFLAAVATRSEKTIAKAIAQIKRAIA